MIDTTVRISLRHNGNEIDASVAHSAEGAVQFAVEMLRQKKRLVAGDALVIEKLADYLNWHEAGRKEMQL